MDRKRVLSSLVAGLFAFASATSVLANPEVDLADRGTVPSCSITDQLSPALSARADQIGFRPAGRAVRHFLPIPHARS